MNWKTNPLARQIILKAMNGALHYIARSDYVLTNDQVQVYIDEALDALDASRPTWKDTHPTRRSWLIDALKIVVRETMEEPGEDFPTTHYFINTAADWLAALDLPDANVLVNVSDSCTRIRDLVALLKNVVGFVPPEEESQRSRDGMFFVLNDIDDLARDVQAIVGLPELEDPSGIEESGQGRTEPSPGFDGSGQEDRVEDEDEHFYGGKDEG